MSQVFAAWSGGKDSCFACYRAARDGLEVRYLLNMMGEDGQRSFVHRLSTDLLEMQSQAVAIPLVQRRSTLNTYGDDFKGVIFDLKKDGVSGGVFGDIDLDEHRQWVEQICRESGITASLPLWGLSQEQILKDFIEAGFEAVIVAVQADLFGEEWLGRKVDLAFLEHLEELGKTRQITPCGEAGEYHTFVVDGPLFKRRIEILEADKISEDSHRFLEIKKAELKAK